MSENQQHQEREARAREQRERDEHDARTPQPTTWRVDMIKLGLNPGIDKAPSWLKPSVEDDVKLNDGAKETERTKHAEARGHSPLRVDEHNQAKR